MWEHVFTLIEVAEFYIGMVVHKQFVFKTVLNLASIFTIGGRVSNCCGQSAQKCSDFEIYTQTIKKVCGKGGGGGYCMSVVCPGFGELTHFVP